MSDAFDEKAAGVTLWHVKSVQSALGYSGTRLIDVSLRAHVQDEAIWKIVQKRLEEGFRVFTGPDFHIEIMDVMRTHIKELEAELARMKRELVHEKDNGKQLQQELDHYKEPLQALGRALHQR